EEGGADVVLFEVEDHPEDAVREFEELAHRGAIETVDARDSVAGREHGARLTHLEGLRVVLELLADDVTDLCGADRHLRILLLPLSTGTERTWSRGSARAALAGEIAREVLELRPDASVVDPALELDGQAAEQAAVG